jgi:activator of HSP90 ATPase
LNALEQRLPTDSNDSRFAAAAASVESELERGPNALERHAPTDSNDSRFHADLKSQPRERPEEEIVMSTAIHQEVVLAASRRRIYEALMDSRRHAAFTANGAARISRREGGAFSCHGGVIAGRNIELVPNRRIVQAWRVGHWPSGVYSLVRFELKKEGAGTRLVLDQTGIPPGHRAHLARGWHARYWRPLRKYLA